MATSADRDGFRCVFVLGTGRCGSTLLHEILARHRSVAFVSNLEDRVALPVPLGRYGRALHGMLGHRLTTKGRVRFAPSEGYRALAREVSPMLVNPVHDLTAEDATPWIADRLREFFRRRAAAQRREVVVHKFTGWPRAGLLHAVFPDARFVHVVRDGRAVAASWLTMPWWEGHRGPNGWGFGPLPAEYAREWAASGHSFAVLAALGWKLLIDAFELARCLVPEMSWLDVRYEDLLSEPLKTLERVIEFAELPHDPAFTRRVEQYELRMTDRSPAVLGDDLWRVERTIRLHLDAWGYD